MRDNSPSIILRGQLILYAHCVLSSSNLRYPDGDVLPARAEWDGSLNTLVPRQASSHIARRDGEREDSPPLPRSSQGDAVPNAIAEGSRGEGDDEGDDGGNGADCVGDPVAGTGNEQADVPPAKTWRDPPPLLQFHIFGSLKLFCPGCEQAGLWFVPGVAVQPASDNPKY